MGGYERNGIPWAIDGVSNNFNSNLLDSPISTIFSSWLNRPPNGPLSGRSRLRKLVNGPEGVHARMAMPSWVRLLKGTMSLWPWAFNAFGIAAGGGAGRMMAEWIIDGEPSLDIWPLDIRRFRPLSQKPQIQCRKNHRNIRQTLHHPLAVRGA